MLASVAMARRGWQLVAVFVLALAVVGMHSLGAGHHGATTTVGHGSHLTAGAEVEADDHLPATSSGMDHHAADVAAPTVAQEAMQTGVMATCVGCLAGEGAMGAIGRDRARTVRSGDLSWLHSWMPVRPGRHDHSARSRTVNRNCRSDHC